MVEAEEEQDGNNGSPCLLLSPEVLEAMETLELMRVCGAGYAVSDFSVIW
jgi:hypothetical protein